MQQQTITSFCQEDHDRLDRLFRQFQSLKWSDFVKAGEVFAEFKAEMERHIIWEEDVLFPPYKEKREKFSSEGTIAFLKAEHMTIMRHLHVIAEKLKLGSVDTDAEEQALLETLSLHRYKEDNLLHPALDRLLDDAEKGEIFSSIGKNPSTWMRL